MACKIVSQTAEERSRLVRRINEALEHKQHRQARRNLKKTREGAQKGTWYRGHRPSEQPVKTGVDGGFRSWEDEGFTNKLEVK